MTKSNITREHEGKHGVLTLGGSRNDVTIRFVGEAAFLATIDGVKHSTFYFSDGWQFTPDRDRLPTEPGWYVLTPSAAWPVLYFLTLSGIWYSHYGSAVTQEDIDGMTELHAADPLVRVSFGVAS